MQAWIYARLESLPGNRCVAWNGQNSLGIENAVIVLTALRLIQTIAMYNELMSSYAPKRNYLQSELRGCQTMLVNKDIGLPYCWSSIQFWAAHALNKKVFAKNLNFLVPRCLQPGGVNLWCFNLRIVFNPIPAGVLENQDMLGGVNLPPPPSKSHVWCPNMTNDTSLESYYALI